MAAAFAGDPRTIPLRTHADVVIEIGEPSTRRLATAGRTADDASERGVLCPAVMGRLVGQLLLVRWDRAAMGVSTTGSRPEA
jgi:hypothetical protein